MAKLQVIVPISNRNANITESDVEDLRSYLRANSPFVSTGGTLVTYRGTEFIIRFRETHLYEDEFNATMDAARDWFAQESRFSIPRDKPPIIDTSEKRLGSPGTNLPTPDEFMGTFLPGK